MPKHNLPKQNRGSDEVSILVTIHASSTRTPFAPGSVTVLWLCRCHHRAQHQRWASRTMDLTGVRLTELMALALKENETFCLFVF